MAAFLTNLYYLLSSLHAPVMVAENMLTGSPVNGVIPDEESGAADVAVEPVQKTKQAYLHHAMLAEMMGVMTIVMLGDGSAAHTYFSSPASRPAAEVAGLWTWGIAVGLGVFMTGPISGAHLNPVVTLCMCVFRSFPWRRFPPYFLAQLVGAMLGALIVYGYYLPLIGLARATQDDKGLNTAGILFTTPLHGLNLAGAAIGEITASMVLLLGVMAVSDERLGLAGTVACPLALVFLVMAIGSSFGVLTGYAINAVRDLGPRIVAVMLYGSPAWSLNTVTLYPIIPALAPFAGGVLGCLVYEFTLAHRATPLFPCIWRSWQL